MKSLLALAKPVGVLALLQLLLQDGPRQLSRQECHTRLE